MDLLFALNELEKLNNSPNCKRHAVRILLVSNVKSCSAALNFACEERKVHVVRSYKEGLVASKEFAKKGRKLIKLIV
jgi:hypothetical protein